MMVLMALFTTFMTTPVLELICPDQGLPTSSQKVTMPEVSLQEIA